MIQRRATAIDPERTLIDRRADGVIEPMCEPSEPMKFIHLDARNWAGPLDVYEALRLALGAPEWHGSSPDAFLDSVIFHDDINALKSPYVLNINGLDGTPQTVQATVRTLEILLRQYGTRDLGSDLHVEIQIL